MLRSYFFIPANNTKFIKKSKELPANYLVFDLEESVLFNELNACLKNLSSIEIQTNHLVRFRFFDENNRLNEKEFEVLIEMGFRHFLIPKFEDLAQVEDIQRYLQNHKLKQAIDFILLVEHPAGLLMLYQILKKNLIRITGLGFGSHDYCNTMGMNHTEENLYFAKQMVLTHAKAFNIDTIDTVSIDLDKDDEFQKESLHAFQMGFDGKFVIHPRQLKLLNDIKYFTDEEVIEAEKVYDRIIEIKDKKTAKVYINGKVYETPHINRIIKIINWRKNHGSK